MTTTLMNHTTAAPLTDVQQFLTRLLTSGQAAALFVAARTPYSPLPMPALIRDPEQVAFADPLAPVAPFNAATQAARVIRQRPAERIALVLRPCEVRALIELAKLNQCVIENVLLIGMTCDGRMENGPYLAAVSVPEAIRPAAEADLAPACQICTHFQPANVDLSFHWISATSPIGLAAHTSAGEAVLAALELTPAPMPDQRERLAARQKSRTERLTEISGRIKTMEGVQGLLAQCLNCHNCRTACPVCYCRECVFLTDTFIPEPGALMTRAQKKGMIKLPQDTTMFHFTRLAHMAHACVGCGHCASVCPSAIPVADLFMAVARDVQAALSYEPGQDPAEPIPYLAFGLETPT